MILVTFIAFIVLFTLVGLLSSLHKQSTVEDYLLASNSTSPYLLGLSTFATNNSGFMFTAIIGLSYTVGFSSVWITIPWLFGDWLASYFLIEKIYTLARTKKHLTLTEFITNYSPKQYPYLRIIASLLIVLIIGMSAAAQFKSVGFAFKTSLNSSETVGILITGVLVTLYSYYGGIRASIWTDFVQSIIMFIAMLILAITCLNEVGGFSGFVTGLSQQEPQFTSLITQDPSWFNNVNNPLYMPFIATFFVILGYLLGGAGIVAQPHLLVRFLAMNSLKDLNKVRLSYYLGYSVFAAIVFFVGFSSRLIIDPMTASNNPESLLFVMANNLLPEVLIGVIIAGLFSSVVSTVDSQILSVSAAFSYDLNLANNNYTVTKMITAVVILVSAIVSIYIQQSILNLVFSSWSLLSAAFGGLVIVRAYGQQPSETLSIVMLAGGLITSWVWFWLGLNNSFYDVGITVGVSLLIYAVGKRLAR